jgi:hypothetical protein
LRTPGHELPRQFLDAPEDLPKQALCQMPLGQPEDKILRLPAFEQPPLEAHQ